MITVKIAKDEVIVEQEYGWSAGWEAAVQMPKC